VPHSYVTVTTMNGTGVLNLPGTAYDTRIRQFSEGISHQIDTYLGRIVHPRTGTFYFDGHGNNILTVPDLISVTSIKEDNNGDGTFDTVWDADDYLLYPRNALPTQDYGRPYNTVYVNPSSNGTQDEFLAGLNRYEVIGTWGYIDVRLDSGVDSSGSLGGSGVTTIIVDGSGIEPGQTILIGTEQIYVQSINAAGTALTVLRGQNGSTIGTHADHQHIGYYTYPAPILEAAIIQAARIWKRKDSGFASEVGLDSAPVWRGGFDPDVKQLLNPFRRLKV
jgi:hypothetical protein